jgi:hypothetical protein
MYATGPAGWLCLQRPRRSLPGAFCRRTVWGGDGNEALAPFAASIVERSNDDRLQKRETSIFGIKICQQIAKTWKYEGMSVDVAENKRTKIVT